MIGGNSYKATIDTEATASFVCEEMADSIAALGRITRTRRQVRLAHGRCSEMNAQLEVEIIIPARNRHNGWLEEKLSVAVA